MFTRMRLEVFGADCYKTAPYIIHLDYFKIYQTDRTQEFASGVLIL